MNILIVNYILIKELNVLKDAVFDKVKIVIVEVISAKNVGSLLKTAFPFQNENIGKCL